MIPLRLRTAAIRFDDSQTERNWAIVSAGLLLQWSHVLSNVETANQFFKPLTNGVLQWSHVLSNVETKTRAVA
jgi:hypothetical protein